MKRVFFRSTAVTFVCVSALAGVSPDPLLLFRASFDDGIDAADFAVGQREFVASVYDRSAEPRDERWSDWQIEKDLDQYRAGQGADGVSGACLSVPVGKNHYFRELGNVNIQRGTVSFWFRNLRPPSDGHAPILEMPGVGLFVRSRYERIQVHFNAYSGGVRLPESANSVGEWHHLAFVYDARFGYKVYFNGELTGKPRWDAEAYAYHTDIMEPDLIRLASGWYRGGSAPFDIDELRVYSEALAAESIRELASGRDLDARSAVAESAADEVLFARHRKAELGWDTEGDFLEWGSERPLRVRKVGVVSSRAVRAWRTGAVDGQPSTLWPPVYQGYRTKDQGLHLRLEEGGRFDYLVLQGGFKGRLYSGGDIDIPEDDGRLIMGLESSGRFIRKALREEVREEELSFFRKEEENPRKMREYSIGEVDFFRESEPGDAVFAAEARTLHLSARGFEPTNKWVRWKLLTLFEPADRVRMSLSEDAVGGGGRVILPALRHRHVFAPPASADIPLAGLRLRLRLRDPGEATRLRIQVRDPVDPARVLFSLDPRIMPSGGSDFISLDALLDLQDMIVPQGEALWLTLTAERELELELSDCAVELLVLGYEEVKQEHLRNVLAFAKDAFIHVSEPRPWGKVALEQCGERLRNFRRLSNSLNDLHRLEPGDSKINALWTWTHPWSPGDIIEPEPPALNGAPAWAVYARETMRLVHDFALWWVENRQIPSGLFGSAHGDDTDLVQDWPNPALVYDTDGRLAHSLKLISDYCWNEGPMQDGINKRVTDTLHAYEEGVNTQPHQALLYFGNPVYIERLMLSTRTVRDYLTYKTDEGKRYFKANYYGTDGIRTEYEAGRDYPGNALMMHPTLFLAYYNRHPEALKLLEEWAGNWAGLLSEAWKRDKFKGPHPQYAQYPTGEIINSGKRWLSWYGFENVMLGMYRMRGGEEKYFDAFRLSVDRGVYTRPDMADWYSLRDMSAYRDDVLQAVAEIDWGAIDPRMGDDPRSTLAYLGWLITGDRSLVEEAAKEMWRRMAVLFHMHTWSEQSADRVAVSAEMVSRMYLGGTPGKRNKLWPTHTVSWEGMDEDFAAWVLETTPRKLKVWIYNFKPEMHRGAIRVWGLDEGVYEIRGGVDPEETGALRSVGWRRRAELSRNTLVELELPPGELVLVEMERLEAGDPLFDRSDLAVVDTDMDFDPVTRTLRFVVHNVGTVDARDVKVRVEGDGALIAENTIALLEAPNDLEPRTVVFEQELGGVREVTVRVDPDNEIAEIWKGNNTAVFVAP